jgi:hypothetical protein
MAQGAHKGQLDQPVADQIAADIDQNRFGQRQLLLDHNGSFYHE